MQLAAKLIQMANLSPCFLVCRCALLAESFSCARIHDLYNLLVVFLFIFGDVVKAFLQKFVFFGKYVRIQQEVPKGNKNRIQSQHFTSWDLPSFLRSLTCFDIAASSLVGSTSLMA